MLLVVVQFFVVVLDQSSLLVLQHALEQGSLPLSVVPACLHLADQGVHFVPDAFLLTEEDALLGDGDLQV